MPAAEHARLTIKTPTGLTERVTWLRDYYFRGADRAWNNEQTCWTTGTPWDIVFNEMTYYIVPETYMLHADPQVIVPDGRARGEAPPRLLVLDASRTARLVYPRGHGRASPERDTARRPDRRRPLQRAVLPLPQRKGDERIRPDAPRQERRTHHDEEIPRPRLRQQPAQRAGTWSRTTRARSTWDGRGYMPTWWRSSTRSR